MMSPEQKRVAQAIVNVFETGRVQGDYGNVTVVFGDAGHLTFGRSQTTLASGNLYTLISNYCARSDAKYKAELAVYLKRLAARDTSLDRDMTLRAVLRKSGADPAMQATQDAFFDTVYWDRAVKEAASCGILTPLGVAVVYDSCIHGSWASMRNRVNSRGSVRTIGEKIWVSRYVDVRRAWLSSKGGLLAKTVYRMDCFRTLIKNGNWQLSLPITAHGVSITAENLGDVPSATKSWAVYISGNHKFDAEEREGSAWVDVSEWCDALGSTVTASWDNTAKRVSISGHVIDREVWMRGSGAWLPLRDLCAISGLDVRETEPGKRIDVTRPKPQQEE